jgi:hypothetical protein
MENKVYIEIDASPWMDANGVLSSVWFGDACEPCYEKLETYEELIKKELESHTVRGRLTNEYGHDNIGAAEKFVIALEEAAVHARALFEELQDVE